MAYIITSYDPPRDKAPAYFMYIQTIRGIESGASWSFDLSDAARYDTRGQAFTRLRQIKAMYPEAMRDRYAIATVNADG